VGCFGNTGFLFTWCPVLQMQLCFSTASNPNEFALSYSCIPIFSRISSQSANRGYELLGGKSHVNASCIKTFFGPTVSVYTVVGNVQTRRTSKSNRNKKNELRGKKAGIVSCPISLMQCFSSSPMPSKTQIQSHVAETSKVGQKTFLERFGTAFSDNCLGGAALGCSVEI
jgi:hypothetical protein